jgi:GTPase
MNFHCGTVAIIGRPNVGKSTLLNRLVGQKIAITSRKPQTTRHTIRGMLTTEETQFIFVDTPGFQTKHGGALNRALNRNVRAALTDVDVVLPVIVAGTLSDEDEKVLSFLPTDRPIVIAVSKLDTIDAPPKMLAFLTRLHARLPQADLVPVSAKSGKGCAELLKTIRPYLPEQPAIYDEDDVTDRDERFLASEFIREKLFRALGEEVPYGSTVVIDRFIEEGPLRRINATIVVDRPGHKAMVLGSGGERMKAIASAARQDMEKLFGGPVFLEVWVKVKSGWTEDAASLKRFGLE